MRGTTANHPHDRKAKVRFLFFLVLFTGTFVAFWLLDLDSHLTNSGITSVIESIRSFEDRLGVLGPILYLLAGTFVIVINVPTVLVIWLSVVVYGPVGGGIIGFVCLHTSSTIMFLLAKSLGRDFTNRLLDHRLSVIRTRFADNGFKTVFYIRLFCFMTPPVNWITGLIDISPRHHFLGTLVGTLHTIIIHVWIAGVGIALLEQNRSLLFWNSPELAAPIAVAVIIVVAVKLVDRSIMKLNGYTVTATEVNHSDNVVVEGIPEE
ncbi:TVP38/TMEM64 family protein [Gemmatimonadota bacterium]